MSRFADLLARYDRAAKAARECSHPVEQAPHQRYAESQLEQLLCLSAANATEAEVAKAAEIFAAHGNYSGPAKELTYELAGIRRLSQHGLAHLQAVEVDMRRADAMGSVSLESPKPTRLVGGKLQARVVRAAHDGDLVIVDDAGTWYFAHSQNVTAVG